MAANHSTGDALADIRRDYLAGGLRSADLADDPIAQCQHWLQQAIDAQLLADPTAMTLATVDAKGCPRQRTVLLKQLDAQGAVFYTHLHSQKAQDIAGQSQVSLHLLWSPLERQITLQGPAVPLSREQVQRYFDSRPRSSQLAAWASQQSQPIASRAALDQAYAQVSEQFSQRPVPVPEHWGGYRVQPQRIEFWQGGGKRLHDRFVYQRTGQHWQIQRLQP